MEVIERKPVPLYEVDCPECKSKIRYKACEVSLHHINCPVCGVDLWANTIASVAYEEYRREGTRMPDREKVMKGLECCTRINESCMPDCDRCPYESDPGEICGVQKPIKDALELLKAQEPGWISVEDRLPEDEGEYLVVSKDCNYISWFKVDEQRWIIENIYCEDGYITHWMALPEPPKEKT